MLEQVTTTSDTGPVRLGTVLPTRELTILGEHDPAPVLALARELDADGVDSLWIGESVLARPRIDAVGMLAAVAAVTERATLGSAVVLPALRNPVAFAHQVASLDQLAGGRLVLGVGAGFPGPGTQAEFAALDAGYSGRVGALDASVDAMRRGWAQARDGTAFSPPPVQTAGPPVWLATGSGPGLARCGARYDGWLPYPVTPEEYRDGLDAVRSAAAAAGRRPDAVTAGLYVTVAIGAGDAPHTRLEEYCQAYYGGPRELVGAVQAMVSGPLDEVVDRLAAYVDAGARQLAIRHGTLDRHDVRAEAGELHERLRALCASVALEG